MPGAEAILPDGAGPAPRAGSGAPPRVGQVTDRPSPETLRLYRGDWARFAAWCRAQGVAALPAAPDTLAAYLLASAGQAGRPALARRKAAVAAMHRSQGMPPPALDRATLADLRAACRKGPVSARRALTTPARLLRLAAGCPGDLAGLRDRALLLLAAATARGRGTEGVAAAALLLLDAEDVRMEASGVALTVPGRAGDEGQGRVALVPRSDGRGTCPARALEDWLRASVTRFGPVFRKVDRWGNVEHGRLGPDGLRRVVTRREAELRGRARPAADDGEP